MRLPPEAITLEMALIRRIGACHTEAFRARLAACATADQVLEHRLIVSDRIDGLVGDAGRGWQHDPYVMADYDALTERLKACDERLTGLAPAPPTPPR